MKKAISPDTPLADTDPPALIQELPIAKQPEDRLIPLTKVLVALPVTFKAAVLIPAVKVEVAEPVTVATPVESEVLVALVVVEFNPVKFCKVLEPVAKILAEVNSELMNPLVPVIVVAKRLVLVD